MATRIGNVVFDVPSPALDAYAKSAKGIAAMYAELLGVPMRTRADVYREANYPADEGDEADPLVINDDPDQPSIAFEFAGADYRAPSWPDVDRPQQAHVDMQVPDLEVAHELVFQHSATLLRDAGDHRVYADCVGHPFCLYPEGTAAGGRITRVVFDCFSPRTLALFYSELLGLPERTVDDPLFVEIAASDGRGLRLGFQHAASAPPRWPEDPAHPQQLHLDLDPEDSAAAAELALRLGAIRLPYAGGGFVYADPAGHPFCLGE